MVADSDIRSALESMLRGIQTPPVPMGAIAKRVALSPAAPARKLPLGRFALAAAALIALAILAFPVQTFAFVTAVIVDGYQAAYRVMGWTPPPPPPAALQSQLRLHGGSLAAAQSRVPFTIDAPAGLPGDVVSSSVATAQALKYSPQTHVWTKGSPYVTFSYRRAGGKTFSLLASRYDPRDEAPSKYMFEAEDLPGGRVALTKWQRFTWRNGDQVITAVEGPGIAVREIAAIYTAMKGTIVDEVPNGTPGSGSVEKFAIPPP